jgi:hypothetical protein
MEVTVVARRRTAGTSRMTHSVTRYIARTGGQAFRTSLHTNPLRVFGRLAGTFALAAVAVITYFLASYTNGGMHLPALLAALLLAIAAATLLICGLLADGICANHQLVEDALQRIKRIEASAANPARNATLPPCPHLQGDISEQLTRTVS